MAMGRTWSNELPQAAIILTDREGHKTEVGRNDPFAASLSMALDLDDDVKIKMGAFSSPYGNGNAWCEIKYNDELVYKGGGSYFSLGAGCTPEVYKPGPWEEKILSRSKRYIDSMR
jgi:hypothetical protein